MSNFSRSVAERPNNNGVGYYTGPSGPNVVITKITSSTN
jgi:hypothetical protein